jgi:tripartite ATP-independent transporter DctM subunit
LVTGNLLATTVGLIGLLILYFEFDANFSVLGNGVWNVVNTFTLTAIPVFILLGEILQHTGLAKRIYGSISPSFERLPGKLLQTNIGTATIFSAISGSSTATTAVVGSVAYNQLDELGYDRRAVVGSLGAGGTLGILIPPSLALIIYGSWMEVSIGKLFIAGIIPGLLLSSIFMVYIGISTTLNKSLVPTAGKIMPLTAALRQSVGAWPFLILVFAVLGTIYLGLATPTESAALGVVAAMILALFHRELTFKKLWQSLRATIVTYSTIMLILIGAIVLGQSIALAGLPQKLIYLVSSSGLSPTMIIILVYLSYIVLGCFVGPLEMMLITLPLTFPLVTGLGYDPVWFGIVCVIVSEIGLLTPPLGVNLFVMMAITKGKVTLGEAARACLPYWLLMLILLALITVVPQIVMFLPDMYSP